MASLRIHSVTNWVKKLRSDKVLAVICGFDPNHIPGIGTFYDFLNRFSKPNTQPNDLKRPTQKPKAKLNRGEKLPPKHPNIVRSLTNRVFKGKSFWDFNKTLSTLLFKIVVEHSISMALIKKMIYKSTVMEPLSNLLLTLMVRRYVTALEKVANIATVKESSLTLMLLGVGIATM